MSEYRKIGICRNIRHIVYLLLFTRQTAYKYRHNGDADYYETVQNYYQEQAKCIISLTIF